MARMTIEEMWWTDPRRELLSKRLGGNDAADIAAIRAWRLAQEFWKRERRLIPRALFESLGEASHLLGVGLAELRGEMVYVRGSSAYLDWAAEIREAARRGGKKSSKRPRDARGRLQKESKQTPSELQANSKALQASGFVFGSDSDSDSGSDSENIAPKLPLECEPGRTSAVWDAYRKAYQARYGVEPMRNRNVNGKLAHFVARLPASEAPEVASFYLTHNDRFYVKAMHPVGLLLRDAEKLRSEWATGRKMTVGEAQSAETVDYYREQMRRLCGDPDAAN